MILIILNCILLTLLFITTIIGLKTGTQKQMKTWLVLSRILYLTLLIGRILISYHFTQLAPLAVTIKFALVILLIALIEISFAKKQSQAVNWQSFSLLSGTFATSLLINICI